MAPVRRAPTRASASLRPTYAPPPLPPPTPASDVDHLSPCTLVQLERLFLTTLPKGFLRDVTPQQRTELMNECRDLDASLLKRWWLLRQWEERRKRRDTPSHEADDDEEEVDSQASAMGSSKQALALQLSPPQQDQQVRFSESDHSRLYQLSPSHSPSGHAAIAESPTVHAFQSPDSPPRPRRSRLTLRMHTQTQYNPSQTPPRQPRYAGGGAQDDPFASPRSRFGSAGGKDLSSLGEGMQGKKSVAMQGRREQMGKGLGTSREELARSIQRVVSGEVGQARSGEEAEEQQRFTVEDVYQCSRIGVNETEDPIYFFCCIRLSIGNWMRVLDLRNPELMFYFSPSSSCFKAWTAYDSQFYLISLPISAITSIKIYHDIAHDVACLLITRSVFARPSISFSTSKPMTLKWETSLHDFTAQNQATRCDTWCVVVQSASAAVSTIERIATSEVEKAGFGDKDEAGVAFLRKVWWGPWDSEKTTVNDLVSSLDLQLTPEPDDWLRTARKGGAKVTSPNGVEKQPTTLEFQHPRLPEERIWCSSYLRPSQEQDLDSPFPFAPPISQLGAGAEQQPDLRCPWLSNDPNRRVLTPWPNPTFPPPVVIEDEWNPTLARPYSASPEKASQPAYRPSLHLNTSQPAKKTAPSSSPPPLPDSFGSPGSGVVDTEDDFASPVEMKAPIDWGDEEALGQEYAFDWLLDSYTHFA
ncbi:hypothetical protein BCR35DRAFT_336304 [Leucosporidium creatinivorum]|uniref:Uncharacterized protein n=1 Tax=Leucosporidium creatinivorum TaxID=106004 RepID=A0A1Y2CC92_9BASI|nr:hypothetical protein BCR35DRAFT_336304 [Leucosporidium creatinivorum]